MGVEGMKKAMFRYKMALAGYSDEQIRQIELWLRTTYSYTISDEEKRDALYEYSKICTDIDRMPMFLRTVDELTKSADLSTEYAAKLIAGTIAGWCK